MLDLRRRQFITLAAGGGVAACRARATAGERLREHPHSLQLCFLRVTLVNLEGNPGLRDIRGPQAHATWWPST
jgi:hypothetical protein